MNSDLETIRRSFDASAGLEDRVDAAFRHMRGLGFDGMIYDYTPRAARADKRIPIPSVFAQRNLGDEMWTRWSGDEYIRMDPVQMVALSTSAPFLWSYDPEIDSVIRPLLTPDIAPVVAYLAERQVYSGVTVPIHLPSGDFATVTGVTIGRGRLRRSGASRVVADLGLIAHLFNQSAIELIGDDTLAIGLTAREQECLGLAAEGNSAKEIARIIDRSIPTVIMHLNAAVRKLGARNRTHAVCLASRRRLI
ncbi:helix-turn-helix transcriptional regulator [Xinfangfangia pollutisoli]|uniref:helix-turn-helix transcriptional regulator n=1 Tax=Xinfangfangia pollutisoli TaxID=2865960 RepID=UPI001CD194FC|nr:LuxR family transcriptional regulator [Xinfangfangia pollutisoli]